LGRWNAGDLPEGSIAEEDLVFRPDEHDGVREEIHRLRERRLAAKKLESLGLELPSQRAQLLGERAEVGVAGGCEARALRVGGGDLAASQTVDLAAEPPERPAHHAHDEERHEPGQDETRERCADASSNRETEIRAHEARIEPDVDRSEGTRFDVDRKLELEEPSRTKDRPEALKSSCPLELLEGARRAIRFELGSFRGRDDRLLIRAADEHVHDR